MKKVLVTSIALGALVLGAGIAMAAPGDGIKGTPHDLSTTGGTGSPGTYAADSSGLDRVCVYCHAPHHTLKFADTDLDYLPLWNHAPSGITSYQMYDAGAFPDDIDGHQSTSSILLTGVNLPGSVSRLCLSCHDGSVGVNQYGFAPSGSTNPAATSTSFSATNTQFLIGGSGDLTNHHPIGFNYAAVQAEDLEIADPSTPLGPINTIQDLLYGGNMECVTCHDVHNTENTGEKFLWVSDQNSNFCCTCHLKCTP